MKVDWRALLAEFIGTMGFLIIGVGSVVSGNMNLIVTALAHGLAIAVFGTLTGSISGGHLNPAVSIGLWLGGKISLTQALANSVMQILGACVGVLLLTVLFDSATMTLINYGTPTPANGLDFGRIVGWEMILTFFLVLAVWGTAVHKKAPAMGAWFIGMTVTMCIFAGASASGASMNPARYLGPSIVSGNFVLGDAVPYIAAPIFGAAIAVLLFQQILSPEPRESAGS